MIVRKWKIAFGCGPVLLLAWLLIGIVLMAAGIASGQTRYEIIEQDGTRRVMDRASYLAEVERIRAGVKARIAAGMEEPAKLAAIPKRTTMKPGGVRYDPAGGYSLQGAHAKAYGCTPGQCLSPNCPTSPTYRGQAAPPMPWRPQRPLLPPTTGQATDARPRARQPSPVVVRIQSKRGDVTKHGTGTLVDWRDGTALVLTCGHILQAGYEPFVVFSDGSSLPAEILAADALYDTALLTVRRSKRSRIGLASALPTTGLIWWAGYGGDQYAVTMGSVERLDGDFVVVIGRARNGDSGGPMYGRDGSLLGILTESSQVQEAGEPWKSSGPHIGWIKQFIAQHWPPASGAGQADIPIPSAPPGANGSTPDAPGSCGGLAELRLQVAALQTSIDNLALKEGPRGLPGKDGRDGKDGTTGAWYLRTVNPLTGEETVTDINPGDTVTLKLYEYPKPK